MDNIAVATMGRAGGTDDDARQRIEQIVRRVGGGIPESTTA